MASSLLGETPSLPEAGESGRSARVPANWTGRRRRRDRPPILSYAAPHGTIRRRRVHRDPSQVGFFLCPRCLQRMCVINCFGLAVFFSVGLAVWLLCVRSILYDSRTTLHSSLRWRARKSTGFTSYENRISKMSYV